VKKLFILLLVLTFLFSSVCTFGEKEKIYVALGDSITTGYGLPEDARSFAEIISESNGYALINHAVDGNTASGILAQMKNPAVLADIAKADLITITCGGNDLLGVFYQLIADTYNQTSPIPVDPKEITSIMSDAKDPRVMPLMLASLTVLSGNAEKGIVPFAESEQLKNALSQYLMGMGMVLSGIRGMNPEAEIIVTTQYNPYAFFSGMYAGLATGMDAGARMLSEYISSYSLTLGYHAADVYAAFTASETNLCNAVMSPLNLDFHPNADGHKTIAGCVQSVLDSLK